MVKTPRTRHSSTKREPVTIDLEADAVRRKNEEQDTVDKGVSETPSEEASGESASEPTGADTESPVAEENTEAASSTAEEGDDGKDNGGASPPPEPAGGEPSRRGGFGTALAAGIVGGIVTLAVAGGLIWANVLPVPGTSDADPAVENLRQELEATQSELAELRQAAPTGPSEEALEQALAQPRQRIGELQETVSALQEAVSAGEAGDGAGLEALNTRLSELESRLAELSDNDQGAAAEQRLTELQSELGSLREAATAARDAASANTERLEELTGRVDSLTEEVASQDEGPRLALIVAASALRSAVERGEPFARELETYTALAPNAPELEPLRQYADTGIPTQAELADEAPQVASRIAASASSLPADAGFFDRLMASARSAVTVRPVGEAEGETPEAIAARMEAAVQQGDYAQALAEYETLPPEAKDAAGDFAEKLRARQAADEVLEKALSGALQPA